MFAVSLGFPQLIPQEKRPGQTEMNKRVCRSPVSNVTPHFLTFCYDLRVPMTYHPRHTIQPVLLALERISISEKQPTHIHTISRRCIAVVSVSTQLHGRMS